MSKTILDDHLISRNDSEGKSSQEIFRYVIPPKRKWANILFLGMWLSFWLFFELISLSAFIDVGKMEELDGANWSFSLIWLVGWTLGGIIVIRIWLKAFGSKEIIKITKDELIIQKGVFWAGQNKPYEQRRMIGFSQGSKVIRFFYGTKKVEFAKALDTKRRKALFEKMKDFLR